MPASQSHTERSESVQRRRRPRRLVDERQDPISGRLLVAVGIVVTMGFVPFCNPVAQALAPKGPPDVNVAGWAVGNTVRVPITLVTADYNLLACASEQTFDSPDQDTFGPVHCEYKDEQEKWVSAPTAPVEDSHANTIQPYSAYPNNDLVMVEGLWAEPAVADRLHIEPPEGIDPKKLARFTAECDLTFIGQLRNFKLRWRPNEKWGPKDVAFVARPSNCEITGIEL